MDKPAYSCGDAFCCGGESYPECQFIETSDGRHYTIKGADEIVTIHANKAVIETVTAEDFADHTPTFRYDPDQDYTDHQFMD